MPEYTIQIDLIGDTAFGRGDGVAGLVDSEIEHDMKTGLPFVKGRTIKGLIVEECANILYALSKSSKSGHDAVSKIASDLFGNPGSTADARGKLSFGNATMPPDFVEFVQQRVNDDNETAFTAHSVLNALTTIRQQTAVDREKGIPLENSLRATRVLRRNTSFMSPVYCAENLSEAEKSVLVACLAATRRAGQNRTRGLGRIQMTLLDADTTTALSDFAKMIGGA